MCIFTNNVYLTKPRKYLLFMSVSQQVFVQHMPGVMEVFKRKWFGPFVEEAYSLVGGMWQSMYLVN